MTKGNKIRWKRGEIPPEEQFLLFSTLFYIYISKFRIKLHIYLFNVVVQFIVFLTLLTLICRGTDISKCSVNPLEFEITRVDCICIQVSIHHIYPKYSDTSPAYHTCSKILTSTIYYPMLCLKIAGWMANSVDLIWVYTVCSGLSVQLGIYPSI